MAMAAFDLTDGPEHTGVRALGNLSLNLDNYRVGVGSEVVNLTFHELELLRIFFAQPDRVISYDDITRLLWGNTHRPTLRHLNVLVHRLRAKLTDSRPYVIETVRGRGYGLLKSRDAENVNDWKE
jgi:DNA-binding response OmpR family regulator